MSVHSPPQLVPSTLGVLPEIYPAELTETSPTMQLDRSEHQQWVADLFHEAEINRRKEATQRQAVFESFSFSNANSRTKPSLDVPVSPLATIADVETSTVTSYHTCHSEVWSLVTPPSAPVQTPTLTWTTPISPSTSGRCTAPSPISRPSSFGSALGRSLRGLVRRTSSTSSLSQSSSTITAHGRAGSYEKYQSHGSRQIELWDRASEQERFRVRGGYGFRVTNIRDSIEIRRRSGGSS